MEYAGYYCPSIAGNAFNPSSLPPRFPIQWRKCREIIAFPTFPHSLKEMLGNFTHFSTFPDFMNGNAGKFTPFPSLPIP